MKKRREYKSMVRSIRTGLIVSRHTSYLLALASFRKKNTKYDPLCIYEYSEYVWRKQQ